MSQRIQTCGDPNEAEREALYQLSEMASMASVEASIPRVEELLLADAPDLQQAALDSLCPALAHYRDLLLAVAPAQRRFDQLRLLGEECQRNKVAAGILAQGIGRVIRDLLALAKRGALQCGRDISVAVEQLPTFSALEVGLALQAYHERERQLLQAELQRLRQHQQAGEELRALSGLGCWELSPSNRLQACTRARELLGLDQGASLIDDGQNLLLSHVLPADRVILQTLRNHALISGDEYEVNYSVSVDGIGTRRLLERARGVTDSNGEVLKLIGIIQQVENQSRDQVAEAQLSLFDPLTGLSNRSHFHRSLQREIENCAGDSEVFSVLVVDLNRFKQINDTRGLSVGDQVLVEVGNRMKRVLRAGEHIARLGDDEFAVIAGSADPLAAALIAERLALSLNQSLTLSGVALNLSASIGTSSFPFDGTDGEALLLSAETAMHEAKRNGLRFAAYQPEMSQRIQRRASLEVRLERAIRERRIELHFQPQVDLQSRRLIGAEVLARWQDPDLGRIDPGEFIGLAEESGLIHALGKLVIEESCQQWHQWRSSGGTDLRLAINMSCKQLEDDGFIAFLAGVAERCQIPPRDIDLELTESSVMRNPAQVVQQLALLREHGFGVSIDDFGTGYSSLSHLRQLPITQIKLDRSFVSGLLQSRRDLSVVNATLTIANDLEVSLIAEGVETAFQAERLQALGYTLAQGYFFDRPLPASVFAESWLSLAEPSSGSGSPP
ncbi:putative bifunctional diguanylate cyclase/phosphodiesterase [Pseudomarimonas arenosa]|uniref:GGDEF domain-containing protein n=1 Tax=Pseudomarimonas arenosa TaxID=2774145 RepID=A0AAW3ZNS5_9GAMM|nr:bifunctional diguanylate cyclase/phosphodiesterase [Pseudomarimonas arenosa]MBD8526289.1 GGDEF domain-containing protein [Pseudomarimonas arenosa]